jgi:hypothetical protein
MNAINRALVASAVEAARVADELEGERENVTPRPVRLPPGPSRMSDIMAALVADLGIALGPAPATTPMEDEEARHARAVTEREREVAWLLNPSRYVKHGHSTLHYRRPVYSDRGERWPSREAARAALGARSEWVIRHALKRGTPVAGRRLFDVPPPGWAPLPPLAKPSLWRAVASDQGERWANQLEAAKALGVTQPAVYQALTKGCRCRGRRLTYNDDGNRVE